MFIVIYIHLCTMYTMVNEYLLNHLFEKLLNIYNPFIYFHQLSNAELYSQLIIRLTGHLILKEQKKVKVMVTLPLVVVTRIVTKLIRKKILMLKNKEYFYFIIDLKFFLNFLNCWLIIVSFLLISK